MTSRLRGPAFLKVPKTLSDLLGTFEKNVLLRVLWCQHLGLRAALSELGRVDRESLRLRRPFP